MSVIIKSRRRQWEIVGWQNPGGRLWGWSWARAVPSADSQLNRHATVAVAACDTKSQARKGENGIGGREWAAGQAKCLCQVSGQTHGHRVACGRTTIVLQSGQCLLRLTTQKKTIEVKRLLCCSHTLSLLHEFKSTSWGAGQGRTEEWLRLGVFPAEDK